MSKSILVLGESGTGKSTSLRNLPAKEAAIINVIGKPLPFRGAAKKYTPLNGEKLTGNYFASDNPVHISKTIAHINEKRPDIKYLIIDDFGYVITNSFMRKASQRGYDKFTDIAAETFSLLDKVSNVRDDLFCILMMHTDVDANGKYKAKTVGKMIDQYVCIEGKFTYVFHALINDGQYQFLTNNDGMHIAKSPLGAFDKQLVDNDLMMIIEKINEYNNGE